MRLPSARRPSHRYLRCHLSRWSTPRADKRKAPPTLANSSDCASFETAPARHTSPDYDITSRRVTLWHDARVTNWKVLSERVVLERKWLTITEQRVALPRDVELEFHLVSSPDWTSVLALTPEREVVVVEQYRHALGGISRELPAGVIDPGETPLQAAKRELREETGYASEDWRVLSVVRTEPVRHTNSAHFFFAADAVRTQDPTPMEDESIQVRLAGTEELLRWVDNGEVVHGIHVGAILMAARRGWI